MLVQSHPTLRFSDIHLRRISPLADQLSATALHFTYSGRAALYHLLKAIEPAQRNTVLVPAFHCPTVVDPVIQAGYRVRYYGIAHDLRVDSRDLLAKIDDDTAAVVVINYFGFPSVPDRLPTVCDDAGIALIEDCAHSFLLTDPLELAGSSSHLVIYSFKKLVPSMVGGAFTLDSGSARSGAAPLRRAPFRDSIINCKRLLEQAVDNLDEKNLLRNLLRRIERQRVRWKARRTSDVQHTSDAPRSLQFDYPFDPRLVASRMPWFARMILFGADYPLVCETRRRNFQRMLALLEDTGPLTRLLDSLPARVCPWTFPVLLEQRSKFDIQLRQSGVPVFTFGETLHRSAYALSGKDPVLKSAMFLSDRLLCIPIHQQCTPETIEKFAHRLRAVLRKNTSASP